MQILGLLCMYFDAAEDQVFTFIQIGSGHTVSHMLCTKHMWLELLSFSPKRQVGHLIAFPY